MVILVTSSSPTPSRCDLPQATSDIATTIPHLDFIPSINASPVSATNIFSSRNSSSSDIIKLANSQSACFPMPESGELSVLAPPSLHHSPKINNATWNARRHLKLNLNLAQQCHHHHHHHHHHHQNNHHHLCSGGGGGGGIPYNNMVTRSGRSSSASPRMPRHEVDDSMTSKKSKLDFCQHPPTSTPAFALPGNQVHNNLHNSQLHLPGASLSGHSVHPKANLVCYLQQNSSSPLTSPSQPPSLSFAQRGGSSSVVGGINTSSPSSNRRRTHRLAATSPTTALINYSSRNCPLPSPEMTNNCGCGLVCTSLGCNTATPSPNALLKSPLLCSSSSSSSRAKVKPISGQDLAGMVTTTKSYLIIDVRSSDSFNNNHIRGALNLCCDDRFNRRRIQMGRTSILHILGVKDSGSTAAATKRRSRHHQQQLDIVVYDDNSSFDDLHEPNQDSALCTVLSSLLRDGKDVFVLEGGLKRFVLEHEELCGSISRSPDHNKSFLYSPTNGVHEPKIEAVTASQVLPFLYLGNERDAKDLSRLRSLNISYVLNVTSHVPQYHDDQGIRYKRIPASDSAQQDLRQYFEEAIEYIDDARQNNAKVLIHCHAGVSRSATVTIAYLLKHTRMAMADAYKFVKGKRDIISPNFNFMGQLLEFEHDLNDGVSPRILQPRLTGIESSV